MKLENRYVVFKIKDLEGVLTQTLWDDLRWTQAIHDGRRDARGAPMLECIVIERDWPEYEAVKAMLEKRIKEEENVRP